MIVAVLHFFKIHGKMIFGNTSIVVQDMFSKTPKSFNTVNVILGLLVDHAFRVIDGVMFPQTLERVVAPELVRVVDRSLPRLLPNDGHEVLFGDSLDYSRVDPAIALQKAKYNAFTLCPTSTFAFASAAKVALVHLDLTRQFLALQLCNVVDRLTHLLVDSRHRLVVYIEVMRQLVRRLDLVKAFKDSNLSSQLCERLLFSTGLVSAADVSPTRPADLERTTKDTLFTSQKVGRAPENVLLPLCHMDILSPYGYYSP